ncbi:MAG TPA: ABC transporter permease [Pyrinomonadaceae bacterium]|nr:ABC transporter permease [Pyrinomonadaceae bacterium]
MLSEIYQDSKYSVRMLRKNPGFACVVVITLALGIGANTAIFSFVNAVILNPLPFPDADRLVVIDEISKEGQEIGVSLLNFRDYQTRAKSFEEIGAFRFDSFRLLGMDSPQRLVGQEVTLNYFRILGVQPQLGRIFTEEEENYTPVGTVVLISDSLWRSTLGSDPNILGRTLNFGGDAYTIIGVMPPGFEFVRKTDVWAPLGGWLEPNSSWFDRGNYLGLRAIAKLKQGISVSQGDIEMRQLAAQLSQEYPDKNNGTSAFARSLQTMIVHEVRSTLLVLMGAVGFVLLIACVNVANLSIARALVREQEMGIRMALGAGRRRLIRQMLNESLLLSLLGGLAGILCARWLLSALIRLAPENLPRVADVQLSGRVLLFTAGLTLLTGLMFGLLPAWSATRTQPAMAFAQGGRSSTSGPLRRRLFDGLLVAEIALALVVVTGAGLMTRTMYKIANVDPGFQSDHVLTMRLGLGYEYKSVAKQESFRRDVITNIKAIPGVESAAFTLSLPIEGSHWGSIFIVEDQPVPERTQLPSAAFNPISPEYIKTMRIPLLKGRLFTEADAEKSTAVVLINETMARRIWPNENPIGKRVKQGWPEWTKEQSPWREVVGVVGDVKLGGVIEQTPLHVYMPLSQVPMGSLYLTVRTQFEPQSLNAPIQAAVHAVDSQMILYEVRTMEDRMQRAVVPQRAAMILLSAFAIVAMLLAVVGIYGVVSWGVVQRTREMGVRMALGALRRDVMWLVLRRCAVLVFAGVSIGLLGAFALTRVLGSALSEVGPGKTPLLFGVKALDPITFIVAPILLAVVAILACCLPARRATKIDPLVALRYE